MSEPELILESHIRYAGLPSPVREYRFNTERKWRFDFAWPALMLGVEVEGGTHTGGRHTRGTGFAKDCEKYNTAAIEGWKVLRFPTEQVKTGEALTMIEKAITGKDHASR